MFKPNSPLGRFLSALLDQLVLNLLYMVSCMPIITIGAATTALYSMQYALRDHSASGVIRPYFSSFANNFKQGTYIFLVMVIIGVFVGGAAFSAFSLGLMRFTFTRLIMLLVAFLYLSTWSWVFPLAAKFDRNVPGTMQNAYMLSMRCLPTSMVLIVVNMLVPSMFLSIPEAWISGYVFVLLFFNAAVTSLINSKFIWRALKKYMAE